MDVVRFALFGFDDYNYNKGQAQAVLSRGYSSPVAMPSPTTQVQVIPPQTQPAAKKGLLEKSFVEKALERLMGCVSTGIVDEWYIMIGRISMSCV